MRLLADLALRKGRLEASETLWSQALQVSVDHNDRDGEARARRGLAHTLRRGRQT